MKTTTKVRIYPTPLLAGALKGMRCQSGCFLLEELGDRRQAARLEDARLEPVNLEAFSVEVPAVESLRFDPRQKMASPPLTEADSLETRVLTTLGFHRPAARRHASSGDFIAALEIIS